MNIEQLDAALDRTRAAKSARQWVKLELMWGQIVTTMGLLAALAIGVFVVGDAITATEIPRQGQIVDRGYRAAYTSYRQQCISRDSKTGSCTSSVSIPEHHPPRWWLVAEAEGGEYRASINVSEHEHGTVPNGTPARLVTKYGGWSGWRYWTSVESWGGQW